MSQVRPELKLLDPWAALGPWPPLLGAGVERRRTGEDLPLSACGALAGERGWMRVDVENLVEQS